MVVEDRHDGLYLTNGLNLIWMASGWHEASGQVKGSWRIAIEDTDFFYKVSKGNRRDRLNTTTRLVPTEML